MLSSFHHFLNPPSRCSHVISKFISRLLRPCTALHCIVLHLNCCHFYLFTRPVLMNLILPYLILPYLSGNPRSAWELYLKMTSSNESFNLLQLIANDCYRVCRIPVKYSRSRNHHLSWRTSTILRFVLPHLTLSYLLLSFLIFSWFI